MRKEPRSIELLSPAKDLICGREATKDVISCEKPGGGANSP